ncbi:hypothetical protein Lesp02_31820 [Lentzea sp. NBRC 105346]|uniref:DUF3152 domain-containing protein n=1 Tax=Lentzea sp. NBRC 105346 TaxID=3032205 RepID=UPI0024A446E0|nr:DUF3152 domain-containing protein [Lentzea sp. NBRC 105346]GLZ30993.1 hypothetical protein Lesp02_31820 [Lentzea sp. NBRC 105346]
MRTRLVLSTCAVTALVLTGVHLGQRSLAEEPVTPTGSVAAVATPTAPSKRVYASSSDLPDGEAIPASGAGTWHVVPGTSAKTGSGPLVTYSVEVEDGVTVDEQAFARFVETTLADPRGWTARGERSVQRVDSRPALHIRLTSQHSAREICGYEIPVDVSCRDGQAVVLSAARWIRGAVAFDGDLENYRRYMVNHETGHFFGQGHRACPAGGGPAPVMMQQTFSVSNDEIVRITGGVPQGADIPQDGKVCRPNPWPY